MSFYNNYIESVKKIDVLVYKTSQIPFYERKKIVDSIYDNYDELIKYGRNPEYLAEDVTELFANIDFFMYIYNQLKIHRNKSINVEKYTKARKLIDSILKYRYKENMYTVRLNKWSPTGEFPNKIIEKQKT